MSQVTISAVIVTYNEAIQLETCLQSIAHWADEIIIVDLGSTDQVKEIALRFSCRLVTHPHVPYVELVRNFAIQQCKGKWIVVLDPDEWLPNSLKRYLRRFANSHATGVVNIPRMNIFFGRWIQHTNFWPDHQMRFFRKGTVQWQKILHSYPITTVKEKKLPSNELYAIRHATYPDFDSLLKKQSRYSAVRAQERYAQGEKASLWALSYFLSREFLSRYVKHRGFLDRKAGIFLMVGLFYYFCLAEWKLLQMSFSPKKSIKEMETG